MKRLEDLLISLYRLHLSFYPRAYREAFGGELLDVFSLALQDARQRGLPALLYVVFLEARGLPTAILQRHLRERKRPNMVASFTHDSGSSDEGSASWLETLVGSWLFALGPIAVILSYITVPYGNLPAAWAKWFSAIWIVIFFLGLGTGWLKGWPRWSLPYLGILMAIAFITLANEISAVVNVEAIRGLWIETGFTILAFLLLIAIFVLFARLLPPLRKLYRNFRLDWTRLSFALYVTALIFSAVDHDEDPVFTLNVFLPSIFILAGAFVHLRSRTKTRRFLALLGAIIMTVFIRAVDGKFFYAFFGSWIVALITAPALLTLLPAQQEPAPGGS